jgi:ferredoxin
MKHTIFFVSKNKSATARTGESLLHAALKHRIAVPNRCRGNGTCTTCKVQISAEEAKSVSVPSSQELRMIGEIGLAKGFRLACQTKIYGSLNVTIPEQAWKVNIKEQLQRQREEEEGIWVKVGNYPKIIINVIIVTVLLTGCLYPQDKVTENQLPHMEQVARVQAGIDQFYADNNVLPIATKEMDTPIFEKYSIEFNQLVPRYIPNIPGAAFEQGGSYLFVLTDVENKPQVRLLDLKITGKIGDIQARVNYYFQKNKSLPVAGVAGTSFFYIDFNGIGLKEDAATLQSPYSGDQLPILMSFEGQVGVDYSTDLELFIQSNQNRLGDYEDIRFIFTDNSIYVPVKSFAFEPAGDTYTISPKY